MLVRLFYVDKCAKLSMQVCLYYVEYVHVQVHVPMICTSTPILCTCAHPLSLYMQVCLYENHVKCLTCVTVAM